MWIVSAFSSRAIHICWASSVIDMQRIKPVCVCVCVLVVFSFYLFLASSNCWLTRIIFSWFYTTWECWVVLDLNVFEKRKSTLSRGSLYSPRWKQQLHYCFGIKQLQWRQFLKTCGSYNWLSEFIQWHVNQSKNEQRRHPKKKWCRNWLAEFWG